MKKFTLFIISFILIVILSTGTVFAANVDYLNADKWEDNSKVKSYELNKTTPENSLYGTFSYVKDNEGLCLYSKISFSETSLNFDDTDDIRISYKVTTESEEYTFSLTNNGMEEDMGEAYNVFDTNQNIYIDGDRAEAISYVQFNGDAEFCKYKVYLFVNNSRYLVADSIKVVKPVTTKPTKQNTTKHKSKTTKHSRVYTTKYKTSTTKYNTTTAKTTKFSGDYSSANNDVDSADGFSYFSRNKRIVMIISIILFIIGLMIVVYNAAMQNAVKDAEEKEKNKDDDNEEK